MRKSGYTNSGAETESELVNSIRRNKREEARCKNISILDFFGRDDERKFVYDEQDFPELKVSP